ncbi:MAG: hypothetical protein Q9199_007493, partial [Rusavskia elegans]
CPKPQQCKRPSDPNPSHHIFEHRYRYGRQGAPDDIAGGLCGGGRTMVDIYQEGIVDIETHLNRDAQQELEDEGNG